MVTFMFNKKFNSITPVFKLRYSLLMLAMLPPFVCAAGNPNDAYDLPHSKRDIALCQREALALHAGVIEQERAFHQQGSSWIRYDIQSSDNSEWSVLCDLATGKILGEQRRIGDKLQ
jgi:hypothetical protein